MAWLNLEDYEYECHLDPEDFRGCVALGAVDLAKPRILYQRKVLIMKKDDPRKYIISHYFIPESKLEDAPDETAGAHYSNGRKPGLMTITEGSDVDLSRVADWFYQLHLDYDIRVWRVGYDQRFSKGLDHAHGLLTDGRRPERMNSDLVMINQNAQTLTNAIKLAEADFQHKLIWYNNHAVDKWCFGNAGLAVDKKGRH